MNPWQRLRFHGRVGGALALIVIPAPARRGAVPMGSVEATRPASINFRQLGE